MQREFDEASQTPLLQLASWQALPVEGQSRDSEHKLGLTSMLASLPETAATSRCSASELENVSAGSFGSGSAEQAAPTKQTRLQAEHRLNLIRPERLFDISPS